MGVAVALALALALALAPLPVRGQEVESVGGGHRPRHALLVIAHAESGRGLLTATALDVEALGRDVTSRGLLTAIAPAVSVRVPLPVGGERRDRSRSHASPNRTLPRIARVTARGQTSDYLLPLPA